MRTIVQLSNRTRAAIAVAALSIVVLAACDSGNTVPQARSSSGGALSVPVTTTPSVPATTAPSATASGQLTRQEITWLNAVDALRKRIDGTAATLPEGGEATSPQLTAIADTLRGCTRELDRIGRPDGRLRPVHTLVARACQQYDKVAACYDTLAAAPSVITPPTQRQLRAMNRAGDCITAGSVNASKIMIDVQVKIMEIRAEAAGVFGSCAPGTTEGPTAGASVVCTAD